MDLQAKVLTQIQFLQAGQARQYADMEWIVCAGNAQHTQPATRAQKAAVLALT